MHFKMTTCRSTRLLVFILTEKKMRVERMDTVMLIKSQATKLGDPNLKTEMDSIESFAEVLVFLLLLNLAGMD